MPNSKPAIPTEPLTSLAIRRWPDGDDATDQVAVEEPLEIRLGWGPIADRGQRPVAITMRTPGADADLALGFLFSEGIINEFAEVQSIGPCADIGEEETGQVIRVELEPGVQPQLDRLQRHFYTTSSCGVCGKESLAALRFQTRHPPSDAPLAIRASLLARLPQRLVDRQRLFQRTGSIHAAAVFDARGEIIAAQEDVGRHNAMDKLIGRLLAEQQLPLMDRGILVSGRASFELLQKAIMAGCPLLAAIGGPSSLAVEAASDFGVTLVGFLRPDRLNLYSRPERVYS
ncbi:MAG: formate dehydrogenase accessory sulfurtransferase FdhD [Xanthomonadales bacterium]|nr:formate dehydrogenase accessory sulfurtransferase FdhD [Xanthomonadales bacterium]